MEILKLIEEHVIKAFVGESIFIYHNQLQSYIANSYHNGRDFYRQFQQQKTNHERVTLVYNKLQECKMLDDKFKADVKSDMMALTKKEKGNRFFVKGEFNCALKLYTKMLMHAQSRELISIAYANRSAALFMLGFFQECVDDIGRAFHNNYPENLKPKLMTRRKKAIGHLRGSLHSKQHVENLPRIPTSQRNPTIPCASNCIEVKLDKKFRKHVYATRDIEIGDVIAVEASTAVVIKAHLLHCHECFGVCYNPIPCDGCTQTLYCSEACMSNALSKNHKHECSILLSLRKLVGNTTSCLLALKMAFNEKNDDILQVAKNVEINQEVELTTAMTAAFMFDLLQKHTQMFQDIGEAGVKDFMNVLLSYLKLISGNMFCNICEFCFEENNNRTPFLDKFACGLYPFYTTFRHSCCANIMSQFYGAVKVMRASTTIKKGQECFVLRGPSYMDANKEDRQSNLFDRFHFKCKCKACKENWPEFDLPPCEFPLNDLFFLREIRCFNVEAVKKIIPTKIRLVKQLEGSEPSTDLTLQRKLLEYCFAVLGNKRFLL